MSNITTMQIDRPVAVLPMDQYLEMKDQIEGLQHPKDAIKGERLYFASFKHERNGLPALANLVLSRGETIEQLPLQGEMMVQGLLDEETGRLYVTKIIRIALASEKNERLEQNLGGGVTLVGPILRDDLGVYELRVYYPRLSYDTPEELARGLNTELPPLETFTGPLDMSPEPGARPEFPYLNVSVQMKQNIVVEDKGLVQEIDISYLAEFKLLEPNFLKLGGLSVPPSFPTPRALLQTLPGANYQLGLRFINQSTENIQSLKDNLLAQANEVWHQPGGLELFEAAEDEENSIPVFLMDDFNQADQNNGGLTFNPGVDTAHINLKVIFARENDYLLAHEMIHVIGICHPEQCPTFPAFEGSFASVAVPGVPNLSHNTIQNLNVVNHPWNLQTNMTSIGNNTPAIITSPPNFSHYIRTFPHDDGLRPLPVDPLAWQADIWNTVGAPNSAFEPGNSHFQHTQPTPGPQNFIFVRVHTCLAIASPGVSVYLFIGVPNGNQLNISQIVTSPPQNNPLLFTDNGQQLLPRQGTPTINRTQWDLAASGWTADSWLIAMSTTDLQNDLGVAGFVSGTQSGNSVIKTMGEFMILLDSHRNIAVRRS